MKWWYITLVKCNIFWKDSHFQSKWDYSVFSLCLVDEMKKQWFLLSIRLEFSLIPFLFFRNYCLLKKNINLQLIVECFTLQQIDSWLVIAYFCNIFVHNVYSNDKYLHKQGMLHCGLFNYIVMAESLHYPPSWGKKDRKMCKSREY